MMAALHASSGVLYWGLGNEMYGASQIGSSNCVEFTVRAHAVSVLQACHLMRVVDLVRAD